VLNYLLTDATPLDTIPRGLFYYFFNQCVDYTALGFVEVLTEHVRVHWVFGLGPYEMQKSGELLFELQCVDWHFPPPDLFSMSEQVQPRPILPNVLLANDLELIVIIVIRHQTAGCAVSFNGRIKHTILGDAL